MKYRTIVADPPWHYPEPLPGFKAASLAYKQRPERPHTAPRPLPYPSMTVQQIKTLSVGELAEPSGCHLYLWTTNRYLPDAFAVLQAWGFRYSQTLIWAKTPMGKGPGGAFAQNAEFVLFARRGNLRHLQRLDTVWFNWRRTGTHSKKPEHFIDMVETVSPGPRLEMFARRRRLGWDALGDAIDGRDIVAVLGERAGAVPRG